MQSKKVKYLIIGAGPAGLQMAYFLQKADLDYLILEKSKMPGAFFSKYPIHKKLISINKKYNYFEEEEFNMRHDWNSLLSDDKTLRFTEYSDELFPDAELLCTYFKDYAEKLKLNILYDTTVHKISKNSAGEFYVKTTGGDDFHAEVLLLGTGVVAHHIPKEIEGIEHTINYGDAPLELDKYKNKRVAIIGSGNSAFETADYIAGVAANVHVFVNNSLKMAWESHFVGNLRAVNNNLLDMYQLKSLHAVLKPRIRKITKLDNGNLQTQHEYDYPESNVPGTLKLTREYEYIINCSGFVYTKPDLFDDNLKVETVMAGKFYALNDVWEFKNVKNMYVIGTGMQAIDRKASSGFIHGFRYNVRTLSNLLLEKFENKAYPFEKQDLNPFNPFLEQLYKRFSIGDAIFQLFGFLGDMLVYDEKDKTLHWYKDLPVKHIAERMPKDKKVLQLTLEFGFHHYPDKSSLDFMGPSDPHNTDKSAFLHPVIRYYYKGTVKEFHFGDSLLGRWDMPHAEGGAIASYHTEFYNWMAEIFGLEKIDVDSLGENPVFEKW